MPIYNEKPMSPYGILLAFVSLLNLILELASTIIKFKILEYNIH